MISRRTVLGAVATGTAVAGFAATTGFSTAAAAPLQPGRLVGDPIPEEDLAQGAVVFSTSFEDADETWYLNDHTTREDIDPLDGDWVMHVHRDDPSVYLTSQTQIPYTPGTEYVLTGHLRAENLSREDKVDGARMALEAYDLNGKWIYGRYGPSIKDAEFVEQVLVFAPTAIVAELRLTLFLGSGITGDAYFDDIVVREQAPTPFATALVTPSYRGLLVPGDHDEVRMQVMLGLTDEAMGRYRVQVELARGETIVSQDEYQAAAEIEFTHPGEGLAPGEYEVRVRLVDADGEAVAEDAWPVRVLGSTDELPDRWVDRHGRLRQGSELDFPLGFFSSSVQESNLALMEGSSFDCMLPYGNPRREWLDLMEQYGIRGIMSLKDMFFGEPYTPKEITSEEDEVPYLTGVVDELKDHPALLAWYIQDERDPALYGDRLMAHQAAVMATDPDHPSLAVDYRRPPPEIQMRGCDAFGVDSYPVSGRDTAHLEQPSALATAAREGLPHRMMWHVVQSFGWSSYPPSEGRPPTTEELRSMAWQYICAGATGLVFYSLHNMDDGIDGTTLEELFARADTVGAEIVERRELILSVEAPPEVSATGGDGKVVWAARSLDDRGHLIVVSADWKDSRQIRFTVPGATRIQMSNGARISPDADDSFTVELEPLEVRWLEFPVRRRPS
ncbi:MAG TPA: hypothetical protein IAA98_05955 [Candidatus Avipropionibacterium avicola]|uniref:Glycoside hydrolase family 2 catalytic domain-containing protein n=1 Tax=Candidatus Avipropionibacterium avicola TaxID=2840701 RepID=A0A9D1KMU3_9ACTN|nr:hypothetical protein [Candidatus Avipropionibacterium avicola]